MVTVIHEYCLVFCVTDDAYIHWFKKSWIIFRWNRKSRKSMGKQVCFSFFTEHNINNQIKLYILCTQWWIFSLIYNIFFREPTPFEHTSAVKIQKNWKAFYVRKITQARTQGKALSSISDENNPCPFWYCKLRIYFTYICPDFDRHWGEC